MRYLFSAPGLAALEKFAAEDPLIAFDFDGTLSPIVADPDRAAIRRPTRALLEAFTSRNPCIVISGRGRRDVLQRLEGLPFQEVYGNHGIEPGGRSRDLARRVQRWILPLTKRLDALPGVVLEDKRFSLSVHFRNAPRRRRAEYIIRDAACRLPGAYLVGGKQVINILPRGAADKGRAVEIHRRRRRFDKLIFVGDDATDESVFSLRPHSRYLGIRIGAKRSSQAAFYLRNQQEIDRLLRSLTALRARSGIRITNP